MKRSILRKKYRYRRQSGLPYRRGALVGLAALLAGSLFFDVLGHNAVYGSSSLSDSAKRLLDPPVTQYAADLIYNPEKGSYIFNEGYSASTGDVLGDSHSAQISAVFAGEEDKYSATLRDPRTETEITLTPQFEVTGPEKDLNRVIYPLQNINAVKVLTIQNSGVKDDIIFEEKPQFDDVEFSYTLSLSEGTEARLEDNGSINVYGVDSVLLSNVQAVNDEDVELLQKAREKGAKNTLLYTIPAPIILELNKKVSKATAEFEINGDTLTLRAKGLQQAQYPLTIDPTIYAETAQKLMRGNNETNIDFDINNQLIQKSQTTGARIDSWQSNLAMSEEVWGHATTTASGYIYRSGGRTEEGTITRLPSVDSTNTSNQSSNSASFTMAMPGTRPAGDLYVALMCHDDTNDRITPPAGWTEYADLGEHAAYYKIGTDEGGGDEAALYTWTSNSEKWGGVIMRITGFDPASPVSPTPTTNSGTSGTPTFPAITPDADNTLIIRGVGIDNDEITNSGWTPSGHTSISFGGPTGTGDCAFAAASMDSPPAGGVSTGTVNMQAGYVNDTYGSSTIAINPIPSSGLSPQVVDTVEWAQFNSSTLQIESPTPSTDGIVCSGWCNESSYNLPQPRQGHSMVAYNGYLYVIGGENGSGVRQSDVFIAKLGANGEPQLWHPTDTNPNNWDFWYQDNLSGNTAKNYLSAVAYDNRMYILGGQTNSSSGGVTVVQKADILPNGILANWTTAGMQPLPAGAGTHMADVVVYNDTLYTIGGFEGAASTANLRGTVYYSNLNDDGTMNPWQQTNSLATPRANYGGIYSYIWGAYIYTGGGCSTISSGNCESLASDMQLASINADGSLGTWRDIGGLDNARAGYTFIGWQGGLYRLGGCTTFDTPSGECVNALAAVDYGVINPAGEVSTVSVSDESGEGDCVGGTPFNCDLPPLGDSIGQGGAMLSGTAILNGYLYVIGGCTNFTCSSSSGNVSYATIGSDGTLESPAACSGTRVGSWCVDSTNRVNGTSGVSAPGIAVFNERIYVVGGIDESANGTTSIYYNDFNEDGSANGAWEQTTFAAAGITGELSYLYAYARANPAQASTNPGNLYIIGGCSAFTNSAGCQSSYSNAVYKCNIITSGAVSGCSTSGQLQIDVELATESNQGLGLHSGTVYANYIYLIGGYSDNVGDRDTVYYARFDDSNNIVDAVSGTAILANDDDDWIESPNTLQVGRRRGSAFGYNGHIYAVGGFNAGGSGEAGLLPFIEWSRQDVSDGSIDSFVRSSVEIRQRWGLSMAISNSYAYVIGGCDVGASPGGCSSFEPSVQTFQLYNNDSGTPVDFQPSANMFSVDRYASGAVIHNGYIYIAGGCTDSDAVSDCSTTTTSVEYAPIDSQGDIGTWSTTASLPAARGWGDLLEAGGTLYWVGGQTPSAAQDDVYYATPNPLTGVISSWSTATNILPADRSEFGAASWNDRLYIVGGVDGAGAATNTVIISPDLSAGGDITSAWTTETTNVPDIARSGNTLIAYANNLYSIGGYDGSDYLLDAQFTQIESDGSIDDAWTYTTSLTEPSRNADGFAANGYMYIVGGRSDESSCEPNTFVAPIAANTTIASGNNPTGVGEWNETNVRYLGDRHSSAVAYQEGRLYILGGTCDALYPDVVSYTESTFDADTISHNVTMPSSVGVGDLLLVFFANQGGDPVTTPPGWTELGWSSDGGDVRASVFIKEGDGTEGGTTVDFQTSGVEEAAAFTYRILAGDWGGDILNDVASVHDTDLNVSIPNTEALNPAGWGTEDTLWFSFVGGESYDSVSAYPSGYTGGRHINTGINNNIDVSASISWRKFTAASEDPGAYTMSDTESSAGATVAVRPGTGNQLTDSQRVVQTALYSQPQLAKYSRMIDTDTDVFPTGWLLNGLDNSIGARWQVRYRSMHDLDGVVAPNEDCGNTQAMTQMTTWGQDTNFGDTLLGDVNSYTPINGSGSNINCARYFFFFVEINAEQTFGYPEDVNRGPTISDLSLFFTSDPNKRLRHGKTFTGGEQQPLDTPCRQSADVDCSLP